jgi:hypothetical protein
MPGAFENALSEADFFNLVAYLTKS